MRRLTNEELLRLDKDLSGVLGLGLKDIDYHFQDFSGLRDYWLKRKADIERHLQDGEIEKVQKAIEVFDKNLAMFVKENGDETRRKISLDSAPARRLLKWNFDAEHKRLTRKLGKLFRNFEEVLKADFERIVVKQATLTKKQVDEYLRDLERDIDDDLVFKSIKTNVMTAFAAGKVTAFDEVKHLANFFLYPKTPVRKLEERGAELITNIPKKMKAEINEALMKGIQLKWLPKDLAKEIRKVGGKYISDYRASVIAHQELSYAFNYAKLDSYKEAGKKTKTWYDGQSGVCEYCAALHKVEIPIDGVFESGPFKEEVAPLHVSCRCSIISK